MVFDAEGLQDLRLVLGDEENDFMRRSQDLLQLGKRREEVELFVKLPVDLRCSVRRTGGSDTDPLHAWAQFGNTGTDGADE